MMRILIGVICKRFTLPRHIADGIRQDARVRAAHYDYRRGQYAPQRNWQAQSVGDVIIVTSRTETAYSIEAVCRPIED